MVDYCKSIPCEREGEAEMPKLLKVVFNDFIYASRDKRELDVVKELGFDIQVLSFTSRDMGSENLVVDGYAVMYPVRKKSESRYRTINRMRRFVFNLMRFYEIRKLGSDVISAHDIRALKVSYLATLFMSKRKRPKLVYDSHEFEIGRSTTRSRRDIWFITKLERFLMSRCAFSIMVSDTIADKVKEVHKLENRPVVARNIPQYWQIDNMVIKSRRKEFLDELGVSEECFIVMYHGGLIRNRGIENLIDVVTNVNNVVGVILGNAQRYEYYEELHSLVLNKGVSDKILFKPAVNIDVLWQYVGAADVGLITLTPVNQNHIFSQPNKLFENIQSLTPVIVSDFPDLRKIVNDYGIGLACDPLNIDSICATVSEMKDNRELYAKFKNNLVHAKEELCWENEKKRLKEAYKDLL